MFRRAHRVNPAFLGVALFGLLAASLAFAFVSHKGIPGRNYSYVTVAFEDVSAGLREGSDVRVSGVRVGQVHRAFYEDGEARVTLQLPGGMHVYRDAAARIRSRSGLGQHYVDIDPGHATAGALGGSALSPSGQTASGQTASGQPGPDVLPKSRTTSLVEFDTVLDALSPPARAGLGTGLRELGAGVGGRGGDLNELIGLAPDLLADLGTTSAALRSTDADLAGFLTAAERLAGRFAGREAEIASLLAQSSRVMGAFDADGGAPLGQALSTAPGALDELRSGLAALTPVASDLRAAVAALDPAAAALGQATPGLRRALRDAVPPLSAVPPVSGLAEPAFAGLTGVARDARPLVPQLGEAFRLLRAPLELLAPYGPEANALFNNLRDAFAGHDTQGNWLRVISIVVGADSGISGPGAPNPAVNRNAYPAPGKAATDAERFNPGGQR